jgi:hypothetical protein
VVADPLRRLLDFQGRFFAHPLSTAEHPIDRRNTHASLARELGDCNSRHDYSLSRMRRYLIPSMVNLQAIFYLLSDAHHSRFDGLTMATRGYLPLRQSTLRLRVG